MRYPPLPDVGLHHRWSWNRYGQQIWFPPPRKTVCWFIGIFRFHWFRGCDFEVGGLFRISIFSIGTKLFWFVHGYSTESVFCERHFASTCGQRIREEITLVFRNQKLEVAVGPTNCNQLVGPTATSNFWFLKTRVMSFRIRCMYHMIRSLLISIASLDFYTIDVYQMSM